VQGREGTLQHRCYGGQEISTEKGQARGPTGKEGNGNKSSKNRGPQLDLNVGQTEERELSSEGCSGRLKGEMLKNRGKGAN